MVAAGFSRGNIKYLVDKGVIEKSARGVYILPEVWDDEIFNWIFNVCSVKKELYDLGIAEVTTPGGHTVRAYSVERTLCDLLRPYSHVDIQIVTEAFKHFITRNDKNIPVLSEYAKNLKVETRLRSYLEVLLWRMQFILKGGFLIEFIVSFGYWFICSYPNGKNRNLKCLQKEIEQCYTIIL